LEGCKHRQEWLKKKGQITEANVATSGVDTELLMASYVEENTFQGKGWIFDSVSTVYICSHKEMFNSLVAKEEVFVKMVDGSAYKIIRTETVNVTYKDGMVHALEAVWYVPESQSNLISIP